jgi:hypothetical protein
MTKLKHIEIKLVDDEGNYSKATVEYPGYIDTQTKHGIDMVKDVLDHMVREHKNGKMDSMATKVIELKTRSGNEDLKLEIQRLQQQRVKMMNGNNDDE